MINLLISKLAKGKQLWLIVVVFLVLDVLSSFGVGGPMVKSASDDVLTYVCSTKNAADTLTSKDKEVDWQATYERAD
jgi:hypothetical protein